MSDYLVTVSNKITPAEAARMIGKSPSCIFRWITDGVGGVKLQHARLGRKLYTSEPALTTFMNEVAAAREAQAVA